MDKKENLTEVLNQVNNVNDGINNMIIPILKDTIKDGNKHNTKLFIFAMCELVVILITVIISIFIVYNQNQKYQEFLSQFDFGEETVYQDLDTHQGGDISNSSITNE